VAGSDDQGSRSGLPNVVFIVGDNVGWGDIGCYGGLAPTPRIDAQPNFAPMQVGMH
jgi:hypothetical protein